VVTRERNQHDESSLALDEGCDGRALLASHDQVALRVPELATVGRCPRPVVDRPHHRALPQRALAGSGSSVAVPIAAPGAQHPCIGGHDQAAVDGVPVRTLSPAADRWTLGGLVGFGWLRGG